MPGDPFKPAQAGQALDIPAAAWNALMASLRRPGRQGAGEGGGGGLAPGEVYVQNNSGADLDRFAVLGVSGPLLDPSADPYRFADPPGLTGVKPAAAHVDGRFVVLAEPAPAGKVALAVAGGVTVCKVNVAGESHQYAKAKADTTDALVSATSGPCLILWKQPGTGDGKWAIVRFGAAGGGAVRVQCTDALGNGATCKAKVFDPAVGAVGDEFEVMVQHLTKVNDLFYVISAGLNSSNLPTYLQLSLPTAKLRGMTLQHMDASGTLGNVDWDYPKGHGV